MKIRKIIRGVFVSVFLSIFSVGILALSFNVNSAYADSENNDILAHSLAKSHYFKSPMRINEHKSMPFQF